MLLVLLPLLVLVLCITGLRWMVCVLPCPALALHRRARHAASLWAACNMLFSRSAVPVSFLQTSETRSQLVGRFLEQYQLTPAEATALQVRHPGLCSRAAVARAVAAFALLLVPCC